MKEALKQKLWDLIRPIHSPVTRRLRRRLGRNYESHPEMELPPPYETVQLDVERKLHRYLHVSPQAVSQIVIVGAHEGAEVERMQVTYPNCRFLCFEPNPHTQRLLVERFGHSQRVTLSDRALSDAPGKAQFYELGLAGNGSLLEPEIQGWREFTQSNKDGVSMFDVDVSTLDSEAAGLAHVDLLWMDVQGAESKVLEGGPKTLQRTKAVFLEVGLVAIPYKGSAPFSQISALLQSYDFTCVGLGVDAHNGSGNALFIKGFTALLQSKAAAGGEKNPT
jgi:2-O-methyltransferase